MTLKIGKIIKNLRVEKNITQDILANALGVTPQAVSRWESGTTYPDIELLPAMADYFSLSIDELLGHKLSERETELLKIKKEADRLEAAGSTDEKIAHVRNALVRYPFDLDLKLHLATGLLHKWQADEKSTDIGEIESLCQSILENSNDAEAKYLAVTILCSVYGKTDRGEKAMPLIRHYLSPLKYCQESVLSFGIGDGKTAFYIQDEIDKSTDSIGCAIQNLVLNGDLPNDSSTWKKKTEMLEISNRLYFMIYGEDLFFYHVRLSQNYWLISTYQMAQENKEGALLSLKRMAYHACAYVNSSEDDRGKHYTSLLTDQLIYPYPSENFRKIEKHNEAFRKLERLKHNRYDAIRTDPRFTEIICMLQECAK